MPATAAMSEPDVVRQLRRASRIASVLAIAAGALVLLGWIFDWQIAKSIHPTLASMKANTSLGFILTGTALLLLQSDPPSARRRTWAVALAGIVVALGV